MEPPTLLERMKLEHLAAQIDSVCEQAAGQDIDYKRFLARSWYSVSRAHRASFTRALIPRRKRP